MPLLHLSLSTPGFAPGPPFACGAERLFVYSLCMRQGAEVTRFLSLLRTEHPSSSAEQQRDGESFDFRSSKRGVER